jgi:hypothetical protein
MERTRHRRIALAFVFFLGLGILATRADDFWTTKKWQDWKKEECNKMLRDSPWTKKWSQSISNNGAKLPSRSGAAQAGAAGDSVNQIDYYVQIRSALPVREAIVRQLMFEEKYDDMSADRKKSFDAQADGILNREYSDVILFHFVYETSAPTFSRELSEYWQNIPPDSAPPEVYMINERGDVIRPIRINAPHAAAYEFEMTFPRMIKNEPVIHESDKTLHLQFPEPAVSTFFPAETANLEFRLDKMIWNGKLAY